MSEVVVLGKHLTWTSYLGISFRIFHCLIPPNIELELAIVIVLFFFGRLFLECFVLLALLDTMLCWSKSGSLPGVSHWLSRKDHRRKARGAIGGCSPLSSSEKNGYSGKNIIFFGQINGLLKICQLVAWIYAGFLKLPSYYLYTFFSTSNFTFRLGLEVA